MGAVKPTYVELNLIDGKSWRMAPGPLHITRFNVGLGWVYGVVKVGEVLSDPLVLPSTKEIESGRTLSLEIRGEGFSYTNTTFDFNPVLTKDVDYTQRIESPSRAIVTLTEDSNSWISNGKFGKLSILRVDTGAGWVKVGDDSGVVVAIVIKPIKTPRTKVRVVPQHHPAYMQDSVILESRAKI